MIAYPEIHPPRDTTAYLHLLMNTLGGLPPTKRMSAYLPNSQRKPGQSPDGAQGGAFPIFGSIATVSTTAAVTPVGTEGTNTVAVAAKANGRSMPSAVLAPQRPFATGARSRKHQSQHVGSEETKYDRFFRGSLRNYQLDVLDVSSCSTRFPSTSVRTAGVLEGDNIEHQLTIDSATDIPCIAKTLIDNSIMKTFRAKLDPTAERLYFQDSNVTISATHTRRSFKSQHWSVIKQTGDEQRLPVWVVKKYVIAAAHEALIRVSSTARPQKDTLTLIEARIASAHTHDVIPQDAIWHTLIVARTVTQWCGETNSALVQIGNPSDRTITVKPNTIVGTISPVTAIPPQTASAITHNHSESSQVRIYLTAALDESFKTQRSTVSRKHSY